MAVPVDELMDEASCYCVGMSDADRLIIALLQRIVENLEAE
jgi:hypothetical protein